MALSTTQVPCSTGCKLHSFAASNLFLDSPQYYSHPVVEERRCDAIQTTIRHQNIVPPFHPMPTGGKSLRRSSLKRKHIAGDISRSQLLPMDDDASAAASTNKIRKRRHLPTQTATKVFPPSKSASASQIAQGIPTKPNTRHFPTNLFRLIESSSMDSTTASSVLSWHSATDETTEATNSTKLSQLSSTSHFFVIWNKETFLTQKMVQTFFPSQSNFRSFERQLNFWGFIRNPEEELQLRNQSDTSSSKQNASANLRVYHHPWFCPGRADLMSKIVRRTPVRRKFFVGLHAPDGNGEDESRQKCSIKSSISHSVPAKIDLNPPSPKDSSSKKLQHTEGPAMSERTSSMVKQLPSDSIRSDLLLPSGACVRINRTIPEWAIPAQEAAIQYLYEKHSNSSAQSSISSVEPRTTNRATPNGIDEITGHPVSQEGSTCHKIKDKTSLDQPKTLHEFKSPKKEKHDDDTEEGVLAFPSPSYSRDEPLGSLLQHRPTKQKGGSQVILEDGMARDEQFEDAIRLNIGQEERTTTTMATTTTGSSNSNSDSDIIQGIDPHEGTDLVFVKSSA